jgi:hypothetical protein
VTKVSRGSEKATESKFGSEGVKERDLNYPSEKKKAVIEMCEQRGWWMWDPMFPTDKEERMFFPLNKVSIEKINRTYEKMECIGEIPMDEASGEALLGDGGLLEDGLQVGVPGMSTDGSMSILDAMGSAPRAATPKNKPQAKPKPQDPPGGLPELTEMDVPTMIRALLVDIRKEGGEAKGFAVQLDGKELSNDLMTQMNKHSKFMHAMAKKLDKMASLGVADMDAFKPYLQRLDLAQQWYVARSKSAKGLLRPFMPASSKAAGKAKAKPKAPNEDLE